MNLLDWIQTLTPVQIAALAGFVGLAAWKYGKPLMERFRSKTATRTAFSPTPEMAGEWAEWLDSVGETQAAECMRSLKVSHFVGNKDA
jgi:hypothetical protein|tara:strand:+ start:253 stop:516 length:264 start_codon:yes stop_codon:yes gene_type:complete